jgi:hypothetical protein
MLRLFKQLRSRNGYDKWRNFLIYAAGEIVLIFLGVSLAVWFNDRSDLHKMRQMEISILTEMKEELQQDKKDMTINRDAHQVAFRSGNKLRNFYIGEEGIPNDSILLFMGTVYRNVTSLSNTASYDFLKANGMSVISDDSLRIAISQLYDMEYENLRKIEETHQPTQFYDNYREKIWEHFKPYLKYEGGIQFSSVLPDPNREMDPELIFGLLEMGSYRRYIIQYYDEIFDKIDKLEERIDRHLKKVDAS